MRALAELTFLIGIVLGLCLLFEGDPDVFDALQAYLMRTLQK